MLAGHSLSAKAQGKDASDEKRGKHMQDIHATRDLEYMRLLRQISKCKTEKQFRNVLSAIDNNTLLLTTDKDYLKVRAAHVAAMKWI